MRGVSLLAFAIVVVLGVVLWLRAPAGNDVQLDDDAIVLTPVDTAAGSVRPAEEVAVAGASELVGSHDVSAAATAPDAESGSVGAGQPGDWPDHVEALIYDHLSKHASEITSINVVKCDNTTCNVSFYASDASEASQARLSRIPTEFTRAPINAGSTGYAVRMSAPGLLEVQITLYGRSVRFVQ